MLNLAAGFFWGCGSFPSAALWSLLCDFIPWTWSCSGLSLEPGRANPRCIPSASLRWACLPASGGKDVLGAQRLPPRPLTQHCHGLPPAWDPCPSSIWWHFRPGGVLPCRAWVELGVKHIPCRQPGDSRDRQEPLLCAAPQMLPVPLHPRPYCSPWGRGSRSISHAEPSVPRGARGTAAELASARGRGCSPGAQPLCFVSCSTNPSLTGR